MDMGVASLSFHSSWWPSSSTSPLNITTSSLKPPAPPLSLSTFSCRCCCYYYSPPPQVSLSTIHKTLADINNSGVIACLRSQSMELAMEAATAALSGGISVLEIVMSTPGVFEVIQQLAHDNPTRTIGVGTVLNVEDAKSAINAGAKFLMSPAMVKDIMDYVQGSETLYIPGVMTPTEILTAYNVGAKIVKVYPVSALGGVRYISALNKPFSHIPMVASQGITIDLIGEYIGHGASSVLLSDAIFDKEALRERNFCAIHKLAFLAALQGKEAVKRTILATRAHHDCCRSQQRERSLCQMGGPQLPSTGECRDPPPCQPH